MALIITLNVGVSHKIRIIVRFALTVIPMASLVMLLSFCVNILLSLLQLLFVRLGILGIIIIGILNQSCHERSHVIVVTLEPSQFLLQRLKPAIALQCYDCRISIDAVR